MSHSEPDHTALSHEHRRHLITRRLDLGADLVKYQPLMEASS